MAQVSAPTTTQNALGFLGVLHHFGKRYNTLLKQIGGSAGDNAMDGEELQAGAGWRRVFDRDFALSVDWDTPTPTQPARLEGANAPTAITYQPSQSKQAMQLFHETVSVTYLAGSQIGRLTSTGVLTAGSGDPVQQFGRFGNQLGAALTKIANDFNHSAWNGTYASPADPTSNAMGMRGVIPAITTNVVNAASYSSANLSTQMLADLYKEMIDQSGVMPEAGLALAANTFQFAAISELYKGELATEQRMAGGNMVRTIYTAFGVLQLMLDVDVPQDTVVYLNPDVVNGAYLSVLTDDGATRPALFFEELAKVGSKLEGQIYGQLSVDYGPEWKHGKITNLTDGSAS
jgi:hypothetical protein